MAGQGFETTFEYKLIYVFRINDAAHKGLLKIGDATVHTDKDYRELAPNCRELNQAAKARIDEYTRTAGVAYELLWTEIAVRENEDGEIEAFRDHKVHELLRNSRVQKANPSKGSKSTEWFKCDLETAKLAIRGVKEWREFIRIDEATAPRNPIVFRPEQKEAIEKTLKQFKKSDRMLWNAKMRFGKTLTALEVAKESGFARTIIITHRPVVSDGWSKDFNKIFYERDTEYVFDMKREGDRNGSDTPIERLEAQFRQGKKYVYFASMQDLRGSEVAGGKFEKNELVFSVDWDFVVVDEAHEGTQTQKGQDVLENIIKSENKDHSTKVLELSGTPFKLFQNYEQDEIYTWDYIMEQEAKKKWPLEHFGDSNPYEELPKLNIYTYHLEQILRPSSSLLDVEDKAFNFREFFRVWTGDIEKDHERVPFGKQIGSFVHEDDIKRFLRLIRAEDDQTSYPFSKDEYREFFKHTLWVVPGVKEAKALVALLREDPVFSQFEIVNVAGEGDEEIESHSALDAVKEAIKKNERTITVTCGRLTTGVSVPEWTAVLMLAGSYSTSADQYLQTIFRVQTPANIEGKMKENCYVFDFAPDRTLKIIAKAVQESQRGAAMEAPELRLQKFLNFCPVIAIGESSMKEYTVSNLLQELKKAYIERVVNNGFDDTKLYNDELLRLSDIELEDFRRLKGIIGASKAQAKTNDIDINNEGFTNEEYEKVKKLEKKPKKALSPEEKEALEALKKKKKQRLDAISILRGISIRIPLLVYGADVPIDQDISVDSFPDLVDSASWEEFMPQGITKNDFRKFSKYYDKDVFLASTQKIRNRALAADQLDPTERVKLIADIFSTFRNPDKETVLTPWRVVNMHMSDTIGGYDFFDERHIADCKLEEPRFVIRKGITDAIFQNPDGKVLEINSKTGLYPLYLTYTFYRQRCGKFSNGDLALEKKREIWDQVVNQNIFVICKTPMAKQITQRTLLGYRKGKINAHAFDQLVNQLKSKTSQFINKVSSSAFWGKEGRTMRFSAVVGNPPYQVRNSLLEDQQNASPVYNYFVDSAIRLQPEFVSMIMPSRWMTGGRGLDDFRANMLEDCSIEVIHDYPDARDCFSNVEIKGGVCYFLWNKNYQGKVEYIQHKEGKVAISHRYLDDLHIGMFVRDTEALSIIRKVVDSKDFVSFERIAGSQTPFGIVTSFKDYSVEPSGTNTMKIYGNKFVGYTSMKYVTKNADLAYKWKVLAPKAVGSGSIESDRINPFVPDNPSICTQTYIIYGAFEDRRSAENLCAYMKTKFFHFLLGQLKNTQQMAPSLFKFVPLLNFEEAWSDSRLYDKYGFTQDEIRYIDSVVWPQKA